LSPWIRSIEVTIVPSLAEQAKQELLAAMSPANTDYEIKYTDSSTTHTIIHGQYKGGFFGVFSKLFRNVKSFVIVGKKSDHSVQVRVNV